MAVVAGLFLGACGEDRDGVGLPPPPSSTSRPPAAAAAPAPGGPSATSRPASSSLPAVDDAAPVESLVPELSAFVERTRGLRFEAPVKVALLDDAAFRRRLDQDAVQDAQELERAERVLRAVGLLGADVDLADALNGLLTEAVAGFYDPRSKELVVRGAASTPLVRAVVVHELTHALQDQHFGLDRPALREADDETDLAFTAMVEGDAVRVEEEYRGQLSRADRARAREEEARAGGVGANVPPVLLALVGFPYSEGPTFVDAVLTTSGQARLDAAFADPPTTSEQVLHPEAYLRGEGADPVAEPPAPAAVLDRGTMGELDLNLLLGQGADPGEAARAAAGWGGGRYVAWADGARTCLRAALAMDTPSDTAELRRALLAYAERRPDTTVEGDGPVTFTACG